MPSKNIVKVYVDGGHYHVYNRGVEKRVIFEENHDFTIFLKYLEDALLPPPEPETLKETFTLKGATFKGVPKQPINLSSEITLIAYCLMPNHFHFLLKQNKNVSMKRLLQSLLTRYSMYFNKKYKRVGKLFQGHYKAALIKDEAYLLHLSRYIHLNPSEHTKDLTKAYSSYSDFLGLRKTPWLKPDIILSYFEKATIPEIKKFNSYKNFVEKYKGDSSNILGKLILE